jgi:UDPglucose 6-dehydrogenase
MAWYVQKCPIQVTVVDLNEERIAAGDDECNIPIYEPGLSRNCSSEEETFFFYSGWKSNREEAKWFYFGEYNKTYGKGKGMAADLKYIELCADKLQRLQKTTK